MEIRSYIPTEEEAGQRLDSFLSYHEDLLSRSRAKALIKEGAVRMNGEVTIDPRKAVLEGVTYTLEMPDPRPAAPAPEDLPLDILFEDAHLIIVNKAAGMAVHPAPGTWDGTLVNALLHHCKGALPGIGGVERPGIVHRLDKHTTGVMVVAKTEAAHAGLSAMFADHTMERAYLAITRGAPRPLVGTIDAHIARSQTDRKKMAVVEADTRNARHAVTHYKAVETFGKLDEKSGLPAAALVECRLETGRTHQIRVHMAHKSVPLIGDPVYRKHSGIKSYGSGEAHIAATKAARAFPRQALHAATLGFEHPVIGEAMRFEAPLPEDMAQLAEKLRAM